jgi:diacylglycerol kinase
MDKNLQDTSETAGAFEVLKKRKRSFGFAFRGIGLLFKTQVNARIQAVIAIIAFTTGAVIGLHKIDWIGLIICTVIVFAAEAVNTAIEKLADHLHPGQHPEIGKVKDLAAGAVLIISIGALAIGILIFANRLFELFFFFSYPV